jgi:hypothetical protein
MPKSLSNYQNKTASSSSVLQEQVRERSRDESIRRCIKDAATLDIAEIIGALVQYMRSDLADCFPDDPLLQRAKRLGISQNIKKLKRRSVLIGYDKGGNPVLAHEIEVELYSALEATKLLTKVFGLENLPAPRQKAERDFGATVERIMQGARERGVTMPDDVLRATVEKRLL